MNGEIEQQGWLQILEIGILLAKALAWPTVTILVIIFFRKEIRILVGRIQKITTNGFEMSNSQGQYQKNRGGDNSLVALKALEGRERTPAMIANEKIILSYFTNLDESEQFESAIYSLTQAILDAHFWKTYNFILGSQIALLRYIKNLPGQHEPTTLTGFLSVAHKNPAYSKWNFETYANFLVSSNLIIKNEDNTISLTDLGNDFLLFLHRYNPRGVII